jgi:4-azaleucine resistance transporter AzlC
MFVKDSPLKLGIQAGLPIALGYFPIAIAFGTLADQAQLSWLEGLMMSCLVYAGASQFVGVSLLLAGTGHLQIITTTFILNLRHLIMSLAVNDQMRGFPPAWKRGLSFFITDETFALVTMGVGENSKRRTPVFMAGLMVTAYLGWVSGTLVGGLGANFIPAQVTTAMTVGLYGLFIGLLVPPVKKSRPLILIAVLSMLINWGLGQWVENGWAIVIATVLAAGVGIVLVGEEE